MCLAHLTAASARNFGYDALQRLVPGGTVALPETYSYDAEGNRLVSHLSAAHTTDAGNRLLQDDTFDYTYDDNGNLASKTDRATLAVTSYSYDAQDQLIRIDFPDTTFVTYAAACPRAGASLTRGTPSAGASPRTSTTAPAGARSRPMSMTAPIS